jgi:hypothetical protein
MPKFYFRSFLAFALIVSSFGTIITMMLVLNPLGYGYDVLWRKSIVGLAFCSVCVLGLFASLSPESCYGICNHVGLKRQSEEGFQGCRNSVSIRGHHADCGRFSEHTLNVHGRCVCAACSGLALGALFALVGAIGYFFLGTEALQPSVYLVVAGEVGVVLGLVQFRSRSFVRLLLNVVFVLSAFLILVEVDSLTGSLPADFCTIGVILVWIFTRTLLSQWDHQRICSNCPQSCGFKEYANSKGSL